MDKTERSELIQARLKAKRMLISVPKPTKPKRPISIRRGFKLTPVTAYPEIPVRWVTQPDCPAIVFMAPKRIRRVSPLITISQIPTKLPKIQFD